MIIGIDVDEVLADLFEELIKFHNDEYGTSLKKEDFFSYYLPDVWGGTQDETQEKVLKFYGSKYFDAIQPIKHSIESIEKLKEDNELYVITSRLEPGIDRTHVWLKKYYKDAFKGIHFAHFDKNMSKADVCERLHIQIMVDDAVKYAKECSELGIKVILFDTPWNRKEKFLSNVKRVHSWTEALIEIEKIKKDFNDLDN